MAPHANFQILANVAATAKTLARRVARQPGLRPEGAEADFGRPRSRGHGRLVARVIARPLAKRHAATDQAERDLHRRPCLTDLLLRQKPHLRSFSCDVLDEIDTAPLE